MRGYTKVKASHDFVSWLNAVWNQYLELIAYSDRYIEVEKVERSFLGIKLKPKLRYVSAKLPDKIAEFVYFSVMSPFGDAWPHFSLGSREYENIPELAALLVRGECYLDGEMLNLYNILLQKCAVQQHSANQD